MLQLLTWAIEWGRSWVLYAKEVRMNIDKAIKNLKAGRRDCGMIPPEEFTATIDLAIEALKRVKWNRKNYAVYRTSLLPGETKD